MEREHGHEQPRRWFSEVPRKRQSHHYDSEQAKVDDLVRQNVIDQLNSLRTHPSVALALSSLPAG
jgi:carbonic anhydrase